MKNYRNFFLLLQSFAFSAFGNYLFNVVAVLWLIDVADSASLVGLLMLVGGIMTTICLLFGGVVADHFSRRSILIWVGFNKGLAILGLATLFFLSNSVSFRITGMFIAQIILGMSSGFTTPAYQALLPDILSTNRLAMGNGMLHASASISQIIGTGLGGLLFVLLGAPVILIITGISFFYRPCLRHLFYCKRLSLRLSQ